MDSDYTAIPESPPRIAIQPRRPNLRATSLGVSPAELTILTASRKRLLSVMMQGHTCIGPLYCINQSHVYIISRVALIGIFK